MHYLIAFAVFAGSCAGIYVFFRKKMFFIRSEVEEQRGFGVKDIMQSFVEQFKQSKLFQRHAPEKVLHKTLSRARIVALKMENKIALWLEKLRMRAQKKNGAVQEEEKKLPGDYWEHLKGKK